jgi:hypothetical protein
MHVVRSVLNGGVLKFRVSLNGCEYYIPAVDFSLRIVHCRDENKLMRHSLAVCTFHVVGRMRFDICLLHLCPCQNNQQISPGLVGVLFIEVRYIYLSRCRLIFLLTSCRLFCA